MKKIVKNILLCSSLSIVLGFYPNTRAAASQEAQDQALEAAQALLALSETKDRGPINAEPETTTPELPTTIKPPTLAFSLSPAAAAAAFPEQNIAYLCQSCGARFTRMSNFTRHMQSNPTHQNPSSSTSNQRLSFTTSTYKKPNKPPFFLTFNGVTESFFTKEELLDRGFQLFHAKPCDCKGAFRTDVKIKLHIQTQTHSNLETRSCSFCRKNIPKLTYELHVKECPVLNQKP